MASRTVHILSPVTASCQGGVGNLGFYAARVSQFTHISETMHTQAAASNATREGVFTFGHRELQLTKSGSKHHD
jgi:hypothetical protein